MKPTICRSCQAALIATPTWRCHPSILQSRAKYFSTTTTYRDAANPPAQDIHAILSTPTWSVRSLLPTESTDQGLDNFGEEEAITPATLSHLLRLSALPQPRDKAEEEAMLATLQSQLHFVRAVRAVDTTDIEPLAAIRDETAEGRAEATIGLEQLRGVLDAEDKVGKHQRPRRKGAAGLEGAAQGEADEKWDPLGTAGWTEGRYIVVKTGSRADQS